MSAHPSSTRAPDAVAPEAGVRDGSGPPPDTVPERPPDPAWVEAAGALQDHLAHVRATVEARWDVVRGRLHQRLDRLREAVEQAAARHRALLEAARFDDAGDPAALWQRTVAYRAGVRESVLRPLREHLATSVLGEAVGQVVADLLDEWAALPEALPAAMTVPEPPGLFRPQPDDLPLHRVRKRWVLGQREARRRLRRLSNGVRRLVRRPPQPLPARSIDVPLQRLVAYHVQVRLPALLEPVHEAVQHQAACVAARLEAGIVAWGRDFLKAERKLDRAAFHQPPLPDWPGFGPARSTPAEPTPAEPTPAEPTSAGPSTEGAAAGGKGEETAPAPDEARARAATLSIVEQAEALGAAARAFQEVLETAPGEVAPPELAGPLQEAAEHLAEDVRRGDTFLLDLRARRLPEGHPPVRTRIEERRQRWATWHEQVVHRLDLMQILIALRQVLEKEEAGLLKRTAALTLQPVFQRFAPVIERLQQATKEVEAACDAVAAGGAVGVLRDTIRRVQAGTVRYLQQTLDSVTALVQADRVLDQPGEEEEARIHRYVEQLPERLTLHVPPKPPITSVDPRGPVLRLEVRTMAAEALAVPLPQQLREPAQAFRAALLGVWGETEQLQHIVQYNLEAALDELAHLDGGKAEAPAAEAPAAETPAAGAEASGPDRLASVRELGRDGLQRAAQLLGELPQGLYAPWTALCEAAFAAFSGEWDVLRLRIQSTDLMEQRWAGMRVQMARRLRVFWQEAREQWGQRLSEAGRYLHLGRRQARRLIQRGQSVVGVLSQTEEAQLDTINAISNLEDLLAGLPLVYRKLFAFEPVQVPSLMEGRGRDLVRVRAHYTRWREQQAGALVLALPLGSGRTSLLNVLRQTVFEEADVRALSLDERLSHPDQLAVRLAEVLGVDVTRPTLEGLERYLRNRPAGDRPLVCMIDNLEHLLLQRPGGSHLIERALIFFSRTDRHVYWVATVAGHAWHFLERTASAASGLVTAYRPAPLNRESLQAILINRHRRSGMPLRFAPPRDPAPLLRQRLRRARTPEEQQAVLREEYFDRLYRLSGQNVMLALYYWLRSTDFEVEQGALVIHPPQALDFGFLKAFDLARAFTLKAFLIHNTLTLEEHDLIFRLSEEQGTFLLESLLNQRIIRPAPTAPAQAVDPHGPILPGVRYRISPLLVHPVTEHLRLRHIIYQG